jgi:hypothetical protein
LEQPLRRGATLPLNVIVETRCRKVGPGRLSGTLQKGQGMGPAMDFAQRAKNLAIRRLKRQGNRLNGPGIPARREV